MNPAEKRAFFIAEPIESIPPDGREILERHMGDNPLVSYTARTRDGRAVKWSDFISQRQLHETALWNGLFRPAHLEHQMVAVLPAPDPLLIGVVLMRCNRDFTERERTLLNALRPHLINAYRNAQAGTALTALAHAANERGDALIVLGALGDPLTMTPRAYDLLAAFGGSADGRLPGAIVEWCHRAQSRAPLPPEPLVAGEPGSVVEARFLTPSVICLHPLRERIAPGELGSLDLARREREVLAYVAEGYTNPRIAAELGIEAATVKKHLERIYEKLGVNTRTAAAAAAFRAADRRPDIPHLSLPDESS